MQVYPADTLTACWDTFAFQTCGTWAEANELMNWTIEQKEPLRPRHKCSRLGVNCWRYESHEPQRKGFCRGGNKFKGAGRPIVAAWTS